MTTNEQATWRQIQDKIRQFNKRILNPFTLSFAGRRFSFYAIVQHEGRRSGREYHTPVLVAQAGDRFIIPLPYGEHVDWCRNVLAAGRCTVVWHGKAYRAGEPDIIDAEAGLPAFPGLVQNLLRRNARETGNDQFLRLNRLAEQEKSEYQRIVAQHPADETLKIVGAIVLVLLVFRAVLKRVK